MKKILLSAVTSLVLCFSMAGCGGGGESDNDQNKTEKTEVTSIVGVWECVDMTMEDNGQKMNKEELEKLFDKKVGEMAFLNAYEDGTGEFTFLDGTGSMTWTESDGVYTITPESTGDEGADSMSAELKDGSLVVTSEGSYLSDDAELKTVMVLTFEYQGRSSKILENWDLEMSEEEVLEMNSQIEEGQYIIADGYLYGYYGGKELNGGDFMMTEITAGDKPEIGKMKKVAGAESVTSLAEHDGYVYGIIDFEKIVKVKIGETKTETVFEGGCNSMQIVGNKIYYTDGNYNLCKMNLKGKDSEKILEKEMYYVYVLPNKTVLYQDDADNESLHIYYLKTGTDVKINDEPSYQPMIYGDYLYYSTKTAENTYVFKRINLYSGSVETAPGDMSNTEFFIDNGDISFGFGGMPAVSIDEWDKLSTKNYGGGIYGPRYSNGEIRIYVDDTYKVKAACESFQNKANEIDLGYI